MHEFVASREIEAPYSLVWRYISDVANWPSWLPTVKRVEPLADACLDVGSKFRVIQPRLRPVVWSVAELNPGLNFVWRSSTPGFAMWANHTVTTETRDRSKLVLEFRFSGLLAPIVVALAGSLIRQYLETEVASLRDVAEATARANRVA